MDLGSTNLIAGKGGWGGKRDPCESCEKHFRDETNMSVITEDGNFYTFNVRYADEPLLLNVEMCDFIHDGETVNRPNNAMEIYLQELGRGVAPSGTPDHEIRVWAGQTQGQAHRLQTVRGSIPA